MYLKVMAICCFASLFGPMCGIGGGSIIKPLLDITQAFNLSQVSFISGVAVISMSAYSLGTYTLSHEIDIKLKEDLPLAIAAAFGGITGRILFVMALADVPNKDEVGMIQSVILFLLALGSFFLSIRRGEVHVHTPSKFWQSFLCFLAGLTWVFLGIGGGPFNMILLSIFFILPPRRARQVSLFIVLFSQVSAMILMVETATVPHVPFTIALAGSVAAIAGAEVGKILARKLAQKYLDKLYNFALVFLMVICVYNMYIFA